MAITLLGGVTVDDGSARLNPRDRVVLATLALHRGQSVRADQLADALWGEDPPASWAKNLQGCIMRLRKTLGPDAIATSPHGYRLQLPDDSVDVHRFERLVSRGRELLDLGQPERAAYTFGEALELWHGPPLPELEEWEPGRIEAARLEELRLEAQELQVEAAIRAGHHQDVLARARSLAEETPWRERRWELLARAQYQAGQQAEALRTIRRVRGSLARDLGLDLGPGLIELEQAILRQDPTLQVEEAPPEGSEVCPYQGLTPYDVDDAEGFFGRDEVVAACLERLRDHGLLAVVGPSGSGKSSLVRAGVAASLGREGRRVVVMTPGPHPYDVVRSGRKLAAGTVLVVDQFEEVFSLCHDLDERQQFLAALVDQVRTGHVVIALRADHLGDLAAHPAFAQLVESGLFLLRGMAEDELRAAIEGPARQAGLVMEPGLVDLLVREVQGEPGALPLLSHALRETWLRREGRTLTVAGYRHSGGIRQAVAQSAESVFAAVGEDRQRALRDLLLRLVTPGPDGAPVRTRMPRRLVVSDASQDELVDLLVSSRLVTSDDGVVELAHEAIANAWPRLRDWLDDDVEGQRVLHHLAQTADAWDSLGRPDSELYRGARLARAVVWRDRAGPDLTATERAFLDAGNVLAAAEVRATAERARQQARMIRRLRLALTGAAVLLAAALVAGGLAVHQTNKARHNADAAAAAARAAQARQLGAIALSTEDIALSNLLAARAVELDNSPATRNDLTTVLAKRPQLVSTSAPVSEALNHIAVSPNGHDVVAYGVRNDLFLIDTRSGRILTSVDLDGKDVVETPFYATTPLAFSHSGDRLAVGSQTYRPPELRILDAHSLRPSGVQPSHLPSHVKGVDVAWSEDDGYLAASYLHAAPSQASFGPASADRAFVLVWDMSAPDAPPRRIDVPYHQYFAQVRISADGRTVYVGSPVTAYDVATGKVLFENRSIDSWLPIDLSPDGRLLAAPASDPDGNLTDIALVDTRTGKVVRRLENHTDEIDVTEFSPDGRLVAANSADRTTIVWNTRTGTVIQRLASGSPGGLSFSPDSATLYLAGENKAVSAWDLRRRDRFLKPVRLGPDFTGFGGFIRPSPGASRLVYYTATGLVFGDVEAKTTSVGESLGQNPGASGSWRPDGEQFAVGSESGAVKVLDVSGQLLRSRRVTSAAVGEVDYSADGRRIAVSDNDGWVRLVDAATLQPIGRPVNVGGSTCCTTMSPDGRVVFTLHAQGPLRPGDGPTFDDWALVDVIAGRVLDSGPTGLDGGGLFADFAPDGHRVAIGGAGGEMLELDVDRGQPVRAPVIGHDDWIFWVAYAPGSDRILTAAADGSVTLWDADPQRILDQVRIPDHYFSVAQFAPHGQIVIASSDGSVYHWDTDPDHALAFACRAAGRDLTQAEWDQYVGSSPYEPTCP